GLLWLLEASVAVQLTGCVPTAKVEPEGGVQTGTGFGPQLSVAVTVKVTTAPFTLVQSLVRLGEQVMVGATVSVTVTLKLHVPWWLLESVAEQLTGVVPSVKDEPDGGKQVAVRTPSQASSALAENETVALPPPV